jgi:TonB family protein
MFSTGLESARLPGRGLFYSLLAHVLFLVATLAVPWNYWIPSDVHLEPAHTQIREETLLLPDLEPMGEASPAPPAHNSGHGDHKKNDAPAAPTAARAVQGVVYQGPQLIVSNPPHPDNYIQTIRQPDLPVNPRLPAPLPIPPMVSIAPVKPVLAPQPQTPQEAAPVEAVITPPLSLSQQLPKVEAPKLPLPAAQNASLKALASAPTPAAMPKLAPQPAVVPNGTHNILVVDALTSPNAPPSAIPPGELYGTFTVSPTGSTSTGQAGGGMAPKGAPGVGSATGTGYASFAGSGNKPAGGSSAGNPALAGAGAGTGTGNGNAGNGKEGGNGSATATGHGSGSGGSANAGSGSSPFTGIMIQGGSGGSGRAGGREPVTAKPQASYGITIVASGASGGGFKDYGIFKDGVSYTVYLDMADAGLRGPGWSLQYGLDLRPSANPSDPPPQAHGFLQPPYAIAKTIPHFSPEAARRSRGGTIVVFGMINPKGKWEGLRIMQSPDPGVNQVVLNALANWTFKPAELNGAPVSVKCLLGVVVNSVPVE